MRRVHVSQLSVGKVPLAEREAHHGRDVLRLGEAEIVEVFDDAGQTARGVVVQADAHGVVVQIESITQAQRQAIRITVASAVPKGYRADWLVEKLSEIGVDRFIPLQAEAVSCCRPAGVSAIAGSPRDRIREAVAPAGRDADR